MSKNNIPIIHKMGNFLKYCNYRFIEYVLPLEMLSVNVSSLINISDLLPANFNKSGALSDNFLNEELLNEEEIKLQAENSKFDRKKSTTGNEIIKNYFINELLRFYKSNEEKKYTELTNGNSMYLAKELSRSFVAHLINDEQAYGEYKITIGYKIVPLKKECFTNTSIHIAKSGSVVLDYQSLDEGVIKALKIRFIREILLKLQTYQAQLEIQNIYNKMFESIEKKKMDTDPNRVGCLVY
jgi:hypothetical protein